jgi:hypothetical protein
MIKIIINLVGQQIIGSVAETDGHVVEITNPRLVIYRQNEDEELVASFSQYCPISGDTVIKYNLDHIACSINPLPEVLEKYDEIINPPPAMEEVEEAPES